MYCPTGRANRGSACSQMRIKKELEERKITDYERYKAGEVTREVFIERKGVADARKLELESVLSEAEVLTTAVDEGEPQYGEALKIKDYLHLDDFEKRVIASLISSARVMGEDCLEVTWKYGNVYEKFLAE